MPSSRCRASQSRRTTGSGGIRRLETGSGPLLRLDAPLFSAPALPKRLAVCEIISRLNWLIHVDARRGLRLCDALPFPGMMEEVFWWGYDVREDRDLIETLLAEAPAAFDGKGAWGSERSVSALLIADLIIQHAEKLQRAVAGRVWTLQAPGGGPDAPVVAEAMRLRDEVETRELPAWMRRAYGLLLQRPDGRPIALGYLAYVVGRASGEQASAHGRRMWPVYERALEALCEALVAAGVGTREVREAWQRAEEIAKEKDQRKPVTRMVRRVEEAYRNEREGEGARILYGDGMSYLLGALRLLGDDPCSEDSIETGVGVVRRAVGRARPRAGPRRERTGCVRRSSAAWRPPVAGCRSNRYVHENLRSPRIAAQTHSAPRSLRLRRTRSREYVPRARWPSCSRELARPNQAGDVGGRCAIAFSPDLWARPPSLAHVPEQG